MWLMKRGNEKCFGYQVDVEKGDEKCFSNFVFLPWVQNSLVIALDHKVYGLQMKR
jgi:hypothetical protein